MHRLIAQAKSRNRSLREQEAKELLAEYGIPVPDCGVATDAKEAVELAAKLGYPVTMKVVSDDILHKSDVGGVLVNLQSAQAVGDAFDEIACNVQKYAPHAKLEGVLVAQHAPQGVECIAGITRDSQLGTALLFGLGGVFVELLEDVSMQLLPVTEEEAAHMVTAIKGARLLTGYRGSAPQDIQAVADLLLKLGRLAQENPEIKELDINPFFVYEQGLMAVDARILL